MRPVSGAMSEEYLCPVCEVRSLKLTGFAVPSATKSDDPSPFKVTGDYIFRCGNCKTKLLFPDPPWEVRESSEADKYHAPSADLTSS